MTVALERKAVAPVEIDATDEEFAKECAELLGYHSLAKSVKQETSAARLKAVLAELDIKPFTTASVTAYKLEMEQKANAPNPLERKARRQPPLMTSPWTWSAMSQMQQLQEMSQSQPWHWARRRLGRAPITKESLMSPAAMMQMQESYTQPVPEFALQTALDIKKKCPDAEFFVESFEQQQRQADPFLIVKLGGAEFYVEVWNQPGYKHEREV